MKPSKLSALFFALFSSFLLSCSFAKTDFDEVGRRMLIMLRNSHYERFDFNKNLGERFFDSYINFLDANHQFFYQSDIDQLREQYGKNLHELLIEGKAIHPATEIYKLYQKRADAAIHYAQKLLKQPQNLSFDTQETSLISRKDASWPEDEQASKILWKKFVTQDLLSEVLRRETIAQLAKKQGKPNPLKEKKSPAEMVSLRFERILHSIDSMNAEDIADAFLSSVARSYDPHTDYFSLSEMEQFKSGMNNSLVGIGALLQATDDGATQIKGIMVGGPADKGGLLKLNDRIVAVDKNNKGTEDAMEDIMFERLDRVVDMIRGEEGSEVRLKVEPADGAPGEVRFIVIQRSKVELKEGKAQAQIIDKKLNNGTTIRLAYLRLPSFYADFENWKVRCSADVEQLIKRFNEEKVEGVLLDLRGNGGGSLEEVRRMTGLFTGAGPVVQVKDHLGRVRVLHSSHRTPLFQGALVVLIDKTSASASEILAGALQDYNRAIIVGDSSTFGKGTVQQPMEIRRMMPTMVDARRAGILKLTIQKFYRVSGSSTQFKGVESDIVLPSILDSMDIGEDKLDYALSHDKIQQASHFTPFERENLFLPLILQRSAARTHASKDFTYLAQDVKKALERREKNTVSLNKQSRKEEIAVMEKQRQERNAERRERFKKLAQEDSKELKLYRLDLEDLQKDALVLENLSEEDTHMRKANEELEELTNSPKWPSKIDPVKREGLAILEDLVQLYKKSQEASQQQNHNN